MTTTFAGMTALANYAATDALITHPGEVVPELRVTLFHRPAITTPVAYLTGAFDIEFRDELQGFGSASLALGNEDPDLSPVWDHSCVLRFDIHGRPAFLSLVEEVEHVALAEGEEHDQVTTLSGRGALAILEESVVYPPGGCDREPFADDRIFSWPSIDYDDSWWGYADPLATQSQTGNYWSEVTMEWPDPDAVWIWAHVPNPLEWAPPGPCYFRFQFVAPDSIKQMPYWVVFDAEGELWLDGQLMATGDYGAEPNINVYSGSLPVTPGYHTIAIRCANDIDPENDEIHNPGGILFTGYAADATGQRIGAGPIVHTGGDWKIVEYPPRPPGMTAGEVIRHVIQEAQGRGAFPEVTLAFTDDVDSLGRPWEERTDISTKIGTPVSTFLIDEMASTYVDVWMSPASFELNAAVLGTRGQDTAVRLHGVTDPNDPMSGNLAGLTHHGVR